MKTSRLVAPRHVEIRDEASPVAGPGDVRVRVLSAGICGTDLALWNGSYPTELPLVLGHEWCGKVDQVGDGVAPRWLGRRVTGEITAHCLARNSVPCPSCRTQLERHCQQGQVVGILRRDGAFREFLTLPAHLLHEIPDSLTDDDAALTEPLAAALQILRSTGPLAGRRVAVLGCGRLGYLAARVAASEGAQVVAASRDRARAPALERHGIAHVRHDVSTLPAPSHPLSPRPSPLLDYLRNLGEGLAADVVVEATGSPHGLAAAIDLVRPEGIVVLKSTPGTPDATVPLTRIVVDEIRIEGSRCGPFPTALRWLQQHPGLASEFVSDRYPLEELEQALATAASRPKVVVRTTK